MKSILLVFIFCISLYSQEDNFLLYPVEEANLNSYIDFIYDNSFNNETAAQAYVALQRLIEPKLDKQDWQGAIADLNEFKVDFPQEWKVKINKIIEILEKDEEGLTEFNLGDGINSPYLEKAPIQTADENMMFFASRDRDGFNNKTDDIFFSEYKDERWTPARKLDAPFNTLAKNESPAGITTDGNTILLFGEGKAPNGGGDIYFADKNEFGWGDSKAFDAPVNSPNFESDANITNEGDALFFVSDREGGVGSFKQFGKRFNGSLWGNTDIYVSPKMPDGSWGTPINLGDVINTPFAERKPFLHPDGKTLYFASEGHPGLGRLDLFMSKRLSDTSWTDWSEPVNFGKEVNTAQNERSSVVNTMGEMAYFASEDRQLNFGSSDVYTIDLPKGVRPEPVYAITGKVIDNRGYPLEADIIWEDLETGKQVGRMRSNPQDGSFFLVLASGKNYGFYAEKEGFFPNSQNIDIRDLEKSKKVKENIVLDRLSDLFGDDLEMTGNSDLIYDSFTLKRKKKLRLNNLFFEYNKSNILKSSYPELNRIVSFFNEHPIYLVEVSGHTDSIGNPEYNQKLSERRANSVRDYLINKGIEPKKLEAKGYGMEDPVATNETEEGRQKNRRVELLILRSGRSVVQE